MDKKENELYCLKKAVEIGLKQKGLTKKIIKRISGENYMRVDEECPDFVKYCPPNSKSEKGSLIGIEHFRVDHFSLKKKDGKIASAGVTAEKKLSDLFLERRDEVIGADTLPEEIYKGIADIVAQQIKLKEESTYRNFIASFQYSLSKHIDRVDTYRNNLKSLSNNKYNIELGFLIEIHSDFRHLFLTNSKGTKRKTDGHMPMFAEVIRIIEKQIDTHNVDFIIFCLGDFMQSNNINVIATPTKNIWKQLEKHNTQIYEYVGEDFFLDEFQSMYNDVTVLIDSHLENGNIKFKGNISMSDLGKDVKMQLGFRACQKAISYLSKGCNIVTTFGTQMLIDCFSGHITGWQNYFEQGQMKIYPQIIPGDQHIIENKIKVFSNKWKIKGESDSCDHT